MKRLSKMINGRSSSSSSKTRHASAAEQTEAEKITTQKLKFASLHEEDDDDAAAHRLGQTPSKKGKVSSSKNVLNSHPQKFVCSKCSKAFQSSKAMCGHMACHSEKQKPSSNAVAKKKLVMDSESDTESEAVQMGRRSRRATCKKNGYAADSKVVDKFDVVISCSSEASEIEQEQEEVAICLMMLSRDSANWVGLNSIGESSDNNSVVMEDRSISNRLRNKGGLSSWYDLNEDLEKHPFKKMDSLRDFNTGFASNGVKNGETGVKIRNFKMNKFEEEDLITEPHLSLKKLKSLMVGDGYSQNQRHTGELCPGKGALNESYGADSCKRIQQKALLNSRSPQPFDVNVASNKQFTAASPYGSGQNSLEADEYHSKRKEKGILDDKSGNVDYDWKKDKYESLACDKDFGSGHEVHFKQMEDNKCDEVPSNFKQNGIQSRGFIDLNLPAPMEDEEANESMGSL